MLDFSDKPLPTTVQSAVDAANLPSVSAADLPEIGSLYRHYKGGLYRVMGHCTVESSAEPGVLYSAVDPLARQDQWMRPLSDFAGSVRGGNLPRFSKLHAPEQAALREYLPDALLPASTLSAILQCMEQPWRFYHGQRKLFRMFEVAKDRGLSLTLEQSLALLFMDIVHIPGSKDGLNESQSAAVALSFKNRVQAAPDWTKVAGIIQDTASSTATVSESRLVLDLDLSPLGDAPLEFCANDELAWLENRHLLQEADPRREFDTRRLRYLIGLAGQGPLFKDALVDLEERARTNIEGLRQAWVQKYQGR